MNKKILPRIIIDLILFLSVLNGWWFVALPLGLIGAYMYAHFVEIIIAGIIYDSLFGYIPGMGNRAYIGTIVAVVIYGTLSGLKKVVRK